MLKYKLERHVMSVHLKDKSYPCRYGCDSGIAYTNKREEYFFIHYIFTVYLPIAFRVKNP